MNKMDVFKFEKEFDIKKTLAKLGKCSSKRLHNNQKDNKGLKWSNSEWICRNQWGTLLGTFLGPVFLMCINDIRMQ